MTLGTAPAISFPYRPIVNDSEWPSARLPKVFEVSSAPKSSAPRITRSPTRRGSKISGVNRPPAAIIGTEPRQGAANGPLREHHFHLA
jgi:hypothetical protein